MYDLRKFNFGTCKSDVYDLDEECEALHNTSVKTACLLCQDNIAVLQRMNFVSKSCAQCLCLELSFIQVRYSLLSQFRKAIAYLFVSKTDIKRCLNKTKTCISC